MLAQYRELESFSKFSSDLDIVTKTQLYNGEKISLLMKQKPHENYSIVELIIILLIIKNRFFFKIPIKQIELFEINIIKYFRIINLKNNISINSNNLEFLLNEIINYFISGSL
ncbi:hypothetical protein AB8Q20_00270 [Candidatus Carsonella ruddii]